MTSAPVTDPGPAAKTVPAWRLWVALAVWCAVIFGFVVLLTTFWDVFGMAVGQALGGQTTPDELVPAYWSFVCVSIGLGIAAVAAGIAHRWVALVLALLLAAGGGILAVGIFSQVQPVVAPVEHVDQGPLPCQCHSGGTCECPGG